MRIGRFLTVNEVNNYIVEYQSSALYLTLANQSIPNNTWTYLSWQTEKYDSDGFWIVAKPTEIVIPKSGIYVLYLCIDWFADNDGSRRCDSSLNLNPQIFDMIVPATLQENREEVMGVFYIRDDQPLKWNVYQNSGGALLITSAQILLVRHVDIDLW